MKLHHVPWNLGCISFTFACLLLGLSCVTPGGTDVDIPFSPVHEVRNNESPEIEAAAPIEGREEAIDLTPALEAGAQLPITRDGVILTALLNNQGLDIARLGPRISAYFVPMERAAFDPRLMATASYGQERYQLAGTDEFTFGAGNGNGGIGPFPQVLGPNPQATTSNLLGIASRQLAQPPLPEREFPSRREIASEIAGYLSEEIAPEAPAFMDAEESLGAATLSTFLPTGTSVFLTGGLTRGESNFVPTEYEGEWTLGVNQALLRGAGTQVNLAALRQARNTVARSVHELEQYLLDLTNEAEQAYWDVALAREVLSIREFAVELAEEQVRLNEDLLAVGEAVQAAVLSAQAEKASREAELHQAQGELRTATIRLMRLLNAPEDAGWDVTLLPQDQPNAERIPVDRRESELLAMHYRPELRQLELDTENRGFDVITARNQRLPQLDLFAEYGLTSLGDSIGGGGRYLTRGRYYNYNVGLELNVPLFNRAEQARHQQAELMVTESERILTDASQRIRAEVREALTVAASQWEQIRASELAVTSREEELRIEQNRYEVGLVTNLDVLQVQRLLIEAQVAAATARVEYIKALTELYAAEGTLLERRGVRFDDNAQAR